MQDLCQVYDLEDLSLFLSRGVSPKSVDQIARMKRLRWLGVGGSGLAPEYLTTGAVDRLKQLLPNTRIDHGD
jgi:hypothetical protein